MANQLKIVCVSGGQFAVKAGDDIIYAADTYQSARAFARRITGGDWPPTLL